MIQADAAEKARKQALTGYNFLTEGAGKPASNQFIDYGRRGAVDADIARDAQMQLLGLAPIPGEDGSEIYPPGTALPTNAFRSPDMAPMTGGPANGVMLRSPSMSSAVGTGGTAEAPVMMNYDGTTSPVGGVPGTGGPMNTAAPTTGGPMAPMTSGRVSAGNAFNNYKNSTGYQFQLDEGSKAITTNAASRGLLNSGGTAKALTKFGQNLASTTFNNYLAQLGGVGTAGQNATVTGQNQLGMVTNAGTGAGTAAGGFIMDGGNAWTQGINGALGNVSQIFANLPQKQAA